MKRMNRIIGLLVLLVTAYAVSWAGEPVEKTRHEVYELSAEKSAEVRLEAAIFQRMQQVANVNRVIRRDEPAKIDPNKVWDELEQSVSKNEASDPSLIN
jgi:hypothetical protein